MTSPVGYWLSLTQPRQPVPTGLRYGISLVHDQDRSWFRWTLTRSSKT